MSADAQFFAQNQVKTKKKITFADVQFWDMKILGGDAARLLGGIHPFVDLHP